MNVHTNWFVCIEQIVRTTLLCYLMLLATFNNIYSITDFKVACFTLDKIVCTQRNFLTANCHKFQVRAVNRSHIVIIIGKLCKTVFWFFSFVVILIKEFSLLNTIHQPTFYFATNSVYQIIDKLDNRRISVLIQTSDLQIYAKKAVNIEILHLYNTTTDNRLPYMNILMKYSKTLYWKTRFGMLN